MEWKIGQTVQVQSRTWAGINKPGGCARITKVHYFEGSSEDGNANVNNKNIQGLDVKYVVGGGCEKNLDPNLVFHFETLNRGGRKRRGRDFLMDRGEDAPKKTKTDPKPAKQKNGKGKSGNKKADAKETAKRRPRILPIRTQRRGKTENEDPQSTTLSSSGPSSPSQPSSPPPQPKRRRKVIKKLISTKKKVGAATASSKNEKPMEVVYADQSIEVSPLDRNYSRKEKSRSPEVRRGLFESRRKSPTDNGKIAAAVHAAASAVGPSTRMGTHTVTATPASTIGSHKKKKLLKQTPQSPLPSQQRSSLPSHATVFETPTLQQQQSVSCHQPLHLATKQPPSTSPKLQLPRPPPKHAVKPGKVVPLKRVFENEMQKARQFIDDLIKPREDDLEVEAEKDPRQPSSPSRFVQFMTIFNRIRLRMDDGTIEEEDFLKQVNAEAIQAYTKDEIDTFIDKLSEQGKVMKSDGNIYII